MHNGLPVSGYQPQSDDKVALVNEFKTDEERILRKIDALGSPGPGEPFAVVHDPRWAAIARTHIQEGFMALNRSVFQPSRSGLPEDELAPEVVAAHAQFGGDLTEMNRLYQQGEAAKK